MTVVAAPIISTGKNLESLWELRNLNFLYKDNKINSLLQLKFFFDPWIKIPCFPFAASHLLCNKSPAMFVVITKDGDCPHQVVVTFFGWHKRCQLKIERTLQWTQRWTDRSKDRWQLSNRTRIHLRWRWEWLIGFSLLVVYEFSVIVCILFVLKGGEKLTTKINSPLADEVDCCFNYDGFHPW